MDREFVASAMRARVQRQLNSKREVWPANNSWSAHTKIQIARLLQEKFGEIVASSEARHILNVGSHGNAYGIKAELHVHLDLAPQSLVGVNNAVAADAELLPFRESTFDAVICVGSVINYCSPPRVFGEISRVLKSGGYLLLEYETSDSFEFALSNEFGKDVTLVETFYNCSADKIYVYSSRYIRSALFANDLRTVAEERFYVLSSLAFRITRSEALAAVFARFDNSAIGKRFGKRCSANVFVFAQKREQ